MSLPRFKSYSESTAETGVLKRLMTNLSKSEINAYRCKCSVKEKQLFFPLCAELAGMLIDDSLRWAASSTKRSLAPECNNCIYHCLHFSPFTRTRRPTRKKASLWTPSFIRHSANKGHSLRTTRLDWRSRRETCARLNFQAFCKGFIRSLWKSNWNWKWNIFCLESNTSPGVNWRGKKKGGRISFFFYTFFFKHFGLKDLGHAGWHAGEGQNENLTWNVQKQAFNKSITALTTTTAAAATIHPPTHTHKTKKRKNSSNRGPKPVLKLQSWPTFLKSESKRKRERKGTVAQAILPSCLRD